jgi:small-conductance mechanosensitive channel/CRP-like cAMP-binding protein
MNSMVPILIEGLGLLAVFAAAVALTAPLRRAMSDHEHPERGLVQGLKNLVGHVSRPLAVLAITELLLGALRFSTEINQHILLISNHLKAWLSFWLIVVCIDLVEGIAREVYILRGRSFPIPELLVSIIRTVLIVASAFLILQTVLEIDISPLLASTALVTAVVGFALQGVLSNLLAGMSMHLTRSVMPADWVRIGDVEGKVVETNWRETRLRTNAGHIMLVPNSTVATATIHNMTWPTSLRRHSVPVGASYSDAPGDVIEALVQAALSVPEVLRDPPPDAYITEFKDFGINYVLRFWSECFHERHSIDGDVARMIWYQFKRRGIEIPFPMSDKLLDDLLTVVTHQRRLPPRDDEIARRIVDLKASDFCTRILVDADGNPLLQDEDLRQVAGKIRRIRYTAGETLFAQGDPGDTCQVVVSGHLQGRVEYEDATQAVEFRLGPGALLGEMSLMTGLPRTATVYAREEVELLEIPQDAFACLLALHPEIPAVLSQLVADRAAKNAAALEHLKSISSEDVAQTLRQDNILKRFLRIIGYGGGKGAACER